VRQAVVRLADDVPNARAMPAQKRGSQ